MFLTGAQPVKTSGAEIRVGVSIDQVAAQQLGSATRFPSIELGAEGGGNTGNCDSGYSCAYSNNISWTSAETPSAKEVDPRRVFDRLFGSEDVGALAKGKGERERRRLSILDFVLEDSRRLQTKLGSSDRRKLDEYFTGMREIERRLEQSANFVRGAVSAPEGMPENGEAISYEEHLRLLCDMQVLAFQTDTTRISTFMFARAGSNRSYRNIGVPDGHHQLSHHQGRPENLRKISEINRFHIQQFAYFVERLRSVREGDGTLLDNCMILYGSGISDGNRHNNENLPLVMAGGGGGSIDTGRHVEFAHETPVCNLFLSMLDRAGASTERFGDSTGRLRGLTV